MIQRKEDGSPEPPTRVYGYLVGVELEEIVVSPELVAEKLADAARFVEGVGDVTVDLLGEVEEVAESPADTVWTTDAPKDLN